MIKKARTLAQIGRSSLSLGSDSIGRTGKKERKRLGSNDNVRTKTSGKWSGGTLENKEKDVGVLVDT